MSILILSLGLAGCSRHVSNSNPWGEHVLSGQFIRQGGAYDYTWSRPVSSQDLNDQRDLAISFSGPEGEQGKLSQPAMASSYGASVQPQSADVIRLEKFAPNGWRIVLDQKFLQQVFAPPHLAGLKLTFIYSLKRSGQFVPVGHVIVPIDTQ